MLASECLRSPTRDTSGSPQPATQTSGEGSGGKAVQRTTHTGSNDKLGKWKNTS